MIHQDLFEKCRRASTREEQRKAWGDLIVFVGNESTSFAVKESIARTVLLEWPYSQVASSVDRVLDACGIVVSVSTCTSILKDLASNNAAASLTKLSLPSVLQACWTTLQRLILASRNEKNGESKTPLITEEADIIPYVNTILLLPQVISNACHAVKVRVPLTATPTKFYPRLVECCFSNNEETPKGQSLYTKALMKSMLTSRRSDHVAMGLARQHPHLQLAKLDLSPRETSNLLLSMMQYFVSTTPQDPKVLKTCLKLIQSSSNEHIEAFVQVLVFSSKDPQYPPIIAQLLDQADGQCLYKHLCDVAEIWSQWSFCHERDSEHQHYVSQVLLCGLSRLGKEKISDSDDLTLCLLQGVTHRLESFFPQTRKDGMRIAQQVAKRLGQDLQFDELEEEPQQKSDDAFIHEDSTVLTNINEVIPTKTSEPKKLKQKSISHKRDPDADYDSDDEEEEEFEDDTKNEEQSEGDNSTIWEEELVGYDLEDAEEDLVETRIPLHLLEALELLRTAENHENAYSRHETALQSLPDLIRKRPDDLPDVAVSLVLQLLRMENKFNISGFVESQHEAMLALTVNEPYSVGQCLIDRLFQDSCLSSRLSILATLQEAAYDLSGSKELDCRQAPNAQREANTSKGPSSPDILANGDQSSRPMEQVIRIETKTRRKRRSRTPLILLTNRFTAIAPLWFYSLLTNFIEQKDNETLWSGSSGTNFLANLFRTLAAFVEFSGIQSSQVLAKDLLDLVWSFRTADVAEVRLAVLVSVATSVAMLSEERILNLLVEDANGLPQIMKHISASDPDNNCRDLACAISHSIVEALESMPGLYGM